MAGPPSFQPSPGLIVRMALWFLGMLALSTLTLFLSEKGTLDPVRSLSLQMVAPPTLAVQTARDAVTDFLRGLFQQGELAEENRRLQEEVERLRRELASREDARQRVEELERLLDFKEGHPKERMVGARVIALQLGPLQQVMAIDRGEGDGVRQGMVVLSEGGSLVGTVYRVFPAYAWVRLITDAASAVNVSVQSAQGEARGVVSGRVGQPPLLDMVPQGTPFREGDLVVTSGLGGKHPPGLLVGTVRSVQARPQDLFVRAEVEPSAPLGRLRSVLVVLSFTPLEMEGA